MLGMLKRHEIEVLVKAGHAKIEVAGLAGVSLSSIKRIAEEASWCMSTMRRSGPSGGSAGPAWSRISGNWWFEILQEKADLPS